MTLMMIIRHKRANAPGILAAILLLCAILAILHACNKSESDMTADGKAVVRIHVLGGETDLTSSGSHRSPVSDRIATGGQREDIKIDEQQEDVQTVIVPFSDELNIVATLVPVSEGSVQADTTATEARADQRAAVERTPLTTGVQYRILAYRSDGTLADQSDFVHGQEESAPSLVLDGDQTYTFVAYSINSTTAIPAITNPGTLSLATVDNVSGNLMYFTHTMQVSGNAPNDLHVVLKHKYSQITTTIAVGAAGGSINAIGQATIGSSRTDANIALSNGALTYNTSTTNPAVNFGAISGNPASITSQPTLLISPAVINASFTVNSLTVNGVTRNNIVVPDLKINPERKYNLNLTFNAPCTEAVGGVTFNLSGGQSQTFSAPAANYGFIFDITRLDNSFNLNINGQILIQRRMATQTRTRTSSGGSWSTWTTGTWSGWSAYDLQFQHSSTGTDLFRNIQFADGAQYGVSGIPQIYAPALNGMSTTPHTPILRVVIAQNGDVSFLGRKSLTTEFLPLSIITPNYTNESTSGNTQTRTAIETRVNPITWNTTGSNTVVASQLVQGTTHMNGTGSGRAVVGCPTGF